MDCYKIAHNIKVVERLLWFEYKMWIELFTYKILNRVCVQLKGYGL